MSKLSKDDELMLQTLRRAVAEALERKRRLGQYAVVWRGGRAQRIIPGMQDPPYADSLSGKQGASTVREADKGDSEQ